jgi:hypothetical protein
VNAGTSKDMAATLAFEPAPAHPMARLAEQVPTPIAPDADYVQFAIACQNPGNERLFANFVLGRDHAWWHLSRIDRRPDPVAVNGLLVHTAHCASDREAGIARVRGAQMQLLLAGSHTSIDPRHLRSRVAAHALSPPDRYAARLLSAYVQPVPAAIAAACLATGRGPGWLTTLAPSEIRANQLGDYRVPARIQHLGQRTLARPRHCPRRSAHGSRMHAPNARHRHEGDRTAAGPQRVLLGRGIRMG